MPDRRTRSSFIKPTHLVLDASGEVGYMVARGLLEAGEDVRAVGALTGRMINLLTLGAKVCVGALDDEQFARGCVAGVTSVTIASGPLEVHEPNAVWGLWCRLLEEEVITAAAITSREPVEVANNTFEITPSKATRLSKSFEDIDVLLMREDASDDTSQRWFSPAQAELEVSNERLARIVLGYLLTWGTEEFLQPESEETSLADESTETIGRPPADPRPATAATRP